MSLSKDGKGTLPVITVYFRETAARDWAYGQFQKMSAQAPLPVNVQYQNFSTLKPHNAKEKLPEFAILVGRDHARHFEGEVHDLRKILRARHVAVLAFDCLHPPRKQEVESMFDGWALFFWCMDDLSSVQHAMLHGVMSSPSKAFSDFDAFQAKIMAEQNNTPIKKDTTDNTTNKPELTTDIVTNLTNDLNSMSITSKTTTKRPSVLEIITESGKTKVCPKYEDLPDKKSVSITVRLPQEVQPSDEVKLYSTDFKTIHTTLKITDKNREMLSLQIDSTMGDFVIVCTRVAKRICISETLCVGDPIEFTDFKVTQNQIVAKIKGSLPPSFNVWLYKQGAEKYYASSKIAETAEHEKVVTTPARCEPNCKYEFRVFHNGWFGYTLIAVRPLP